MHRNQVGPYLRRIAAGEDITTVAAEAYKAITVPTRPPRSSQDQRPRPAPSPRYPPLGAIITLGGGQGVPVGVRYSNGRPK
jgi:hypothetical protein